MNHRPRLISQYANPEHHPKRPKFDTIFVESHRGKLTNDPLAAHQEDEDNAQAEIRRAVQNAGDENGNEEDEEDDDDDNDEEFYNEINLTAMDIELFGGDLRGEMDDGDGGDIDFLADGSVLL